MKRQKRSPLDRAYSKGYQAGISGRSKSGCPHEEQIARQTWLTGWREGREDHWNGMNDAASAQKIANFNN